MMCWVWAPRLQRLRLRRPIMLRYDLVITCAVVCLNKFAGLGFFNSKSHDGLTSCKDFPFFFYSFLLFIIFHLNAQVNFSISVLFLIIELIWLNASLYNSHYIFSLLPWFGISSFGNRSANSIQFSFFISG